VKNCANDWQRAQARQQRRQRAAARPEAETMFAAPLEQDERRAAVEAALSSLPQNQAEVLILKIWGGLSFPEIARALDLSENTAASRYRYALAKLREQLAEEPTYE
jgi:RNA polymerase sigma-70 factor (ECF subfamily)